MSLTLPPRGVDIVLLGRVAGGRDIRCPLPPYSELDHTVTGAAMGLALNAFLFGPPGSWFSLAGVLVLAARAGLGVRRVLPSVRHPRDGRRRRETDGRGGSHGGLQDWLGIFVITAVLGGVMAVILAASHGRIQKTLWNVVFILTEMKSGRPAYIKKEEWTCAAPKRWACRTAR